MSSNFFITGTDTEIGKTYVSILLLKHFIAKGEKAVVMKPIASVDEEPSEDVEAICEAMTSCGNDVTEELLSDIAPITFPKPFAPYALKDYTCENLQNKLLNSYKNLQDKFTIILVEGIGGTLVPIEKDFCAADIATLLEIPVIVVAEDKLGVINHTLLTFESLTVRGLNVLGFIMNRYQTTTEPNLRTNAEIIEELSGFPCVGKVVEGELKDCTLLPLS